MAQTKAQLLGPVVGDVVMDVSTLSLDAEGNKVGIGTTGATATLHVFEPTEGDAVVQFNSGDNFPTVNRGLILKAATGPTGYAGSKWIFDAQSSGGRLEFQTASTPRLTILEGGNIGINRTDPAQRLNISGNIEVNAYDNANGQGGYYTAKGLIIGNAYDAGKTTTDDRNAIIWQERGLDLDIATNNTVRMKITYDGNVGINDTTPTSYANSQATLVIKDDTNPAICLNDTGQSRDWWLVAQGDGLTVRYGDGGGSGSASNITTSMFFRDNGNVGINNTDPTRQLEIYNSSHATAALKSDTQSSLFFADSDTNIGQISYMHTGTPNNYMYFRVNDQERLRITSAGLLQLDNGNQITAADTTTYIGLGGGNSTSNGANMFLYGGSHSSNASAFVFRTNTTERLRINSDGKLILSGTARTTPFISGDGGMCIEQSYDGNLRAITIRNKDTDAAAATSLAFSLNRSGSDYDFVSGEIKSIKEQAWTTTDTTIDSAMVFSTTANNLLSERLRISNTGELSISGSRSGNNVSDAILRFNIVNSNGDGKKAEIKAIKTADITSELIFSTTVSHTFGERMRISSTGAINMPGGLLNLGTADTSSGHINSYENMSFNIDTDNDDGNRYFSWHTNSSSASGTELMRLTDDGNLGIGGQDPGTGDGGNSNYNNWDTPKLHVRGPGNSGKFHLLGRFHAGNDSDNTGAQIVIHHENDRGMALQGGRSSGNKSYGAIKSLDNLARECNVMEFRGGSGQGIEHIKFYAHPTSNSTSEVLHLEQYQIRGNAERSSFGGSDRRRYQMLSGIKTFSASNTYVELFKSGHSHSLEITYQILQNESYAYGGAHGKVQFYTAYGSTTGAVNHNYRRIGMNGGQISGDPVFAYQNSGGSTSYVIKCAVPFSGTSNGDFKIAFTVTGMSSDMMYVI